MSNHPNFPGAVVNMLDRERSQIGRTLTAYEEAARLKGTILIVAGIVFMAAFTGLMVLLAPELVTGPGGLTGMITLNALLSLLVVTGIALRIRNRRK